MQHVISVIAAVGNVCAKVFVNSIDSKQQACVGCAKPCVFECQAPGLSHIRLVGNYCPLSNCRHDSLRILRQGFGRAQALYSMQVGSALYV